MNVIRVLLSHPKKTIVVLFTVLLLLSGVLLAVSAFVEPKVRSKIPGNNQTLSLSSALKLSFTLPPKRRVLTYNISPDIEGSWYWSEGLWGHFSNKLTFMPETFWLPNTTYTVTLNGLTGLISRNSPMSWEYTFQTSSLPTVVSAANFDSKETILPDEAILLNLDQANDGLADFSFQLEPAVEIIVEINEEATSYRINTLNGLSPGTQYVLSVFREPISFSRSTRTITKRGEKVEVWTKKFSTAAGPALESISVNGQNVLPNVAEITLNFKEEMETIDLKENVAINPKISGSWRWTNNRTIIFSSTESLAIDTTYVLNLATAFQTTRGVKLREVFEHKFKTVGEVELLSVKPNQKTAVSLESPIELTFNQPVNTDSVAKRFSITPDILGSISWSGNRMTFDPVAPLDYFTTYKVEIAPGIETVYGFNSGKVLGLTFTTEEKTVLLSGVFDRQDRNLSCEAATLKMALAIKGVRVSEDEIMGVVGFDPTVRAGSIWGDPDTAFVGDINGTQNATGYGVHWEPIATTARLWVQARAERDLTLAKVANEIERGNPVMVWGTVGNAYRDSWQTPSGKTVSSWKGEHTRLVIGFRGSSFNPTAVTLLDPLHGRLTWSAAKFNANWASFDNSAVIIY